MVYILNLKPAAVLKTFKGLLRGGALYHNALRNSYKLTLVQSLFCCFLNSYELLPSIIMVWISLDISKPIPKYTGEQHSKGGK